MYTILSWYLPGTSKATAESFLASVERWLTDPNRQAGYQLPFTEPLSNLASAPFHTVQGERDSLQIVNAYSADCRRTAVSLHHQNGNSLWVVEAILQKKTGDSEDASFFVYFRKRVPDQSSPTDRVSPRLPKLPLVLIEDGLCTKEHPLAEESFEGMLMPNERQAELLRNHPMPLYPILTVNTRHGLVEPACIEILERQVTLCHLVCEESDAPWVYQISYPRLSHVAEYYLASQMRQTKWPPRSEDDFTRRIVLPNRQGSAPFMITQELISLVGEGCGGSLETDFHTVKELMRSQYRNADATVPVTKALARCLRDARRNAAITQGELAELTEQNLKENELSSGGLLISRIETQRLHRIETDRLRPLIRCLGLDEWEVLRLVNVEDAEEPSREEESAESVDSGADADVNFCFKCGERVLSPDACFCFKCGQRIRP